MEIEDPESIYCPNCKRQTSITIKEGYSVPCESIDPPFVYYAIAECDICRALAFIEEAEYFVRAHFVIPKPVDSETPKFLRDDLEEVNSCLSIGANKAAAVMARRTLELCCIEKGAPKNESLKKQISWLFKQGVITERSKKLADEVRLTGNDAIHASADALGGRYVSRSDAEEILKLLEHFIKDLYMMSDLTEKRQNQRENT